MNDNESGLYYLQSRYYDPKICRFINADAFTSTGQGPIGYNMFAYCANNSVNCYDPNGYTFADVKQEYFDGGIGSGFIYNQNDEPYGSKKFGLTTISHGGCGAVAVYNALLIMGRYDLSLNYVIEYFEKNNGLLLGGILGSSPYTCIDFFEKHGYSVIATRDTAMYGDMPNLADACILWCSFDTSSFPGLGSHFMAFEQSGNCGTYYNVYSNSKGAEKYAGDCHDFLGSYGGSFPVLILIYDTAG